MTTAVQFTFSKDEKLCNVRIIDSLFNSGRSLQAGSYRLLWLKTHWPSSSPVKVVFIIPKRALKRAVDRNLLRRQMREVYRHHKHSLTEMCSRKPCCIALALMFYGKKPVPFPETERKIILLLHRLKETLAVDGE